MKGIIKAGEAQCLKTKGMNCAQFLHLKNTFQKSQKKPKLSTSIQKEEKSKETCGTRWSQWVLITWVRCYRVYPKRQEHQLFTLINASEALPSRNWLRVDWKPEK